MVNTHNRNCPQHQRPGAHAQATYAHAEVTHHLEVDDAVLDVEDELQRLVVALHLVDVERQVLHLLERPLEGAAVRRLLVRVLD